MTRSTLVERYRYVRQATEELAEPLSPEDQQLQSMPSASPAKWHRAHTTWFFEEFILGPQGRAPFDPRYRYLFNSYYDAVGPRHPRPKRGLLSRPSCDDVTAYRGAVDERMVELLQSLDDDALEALAPLVRLGLAHEEQHQELLLTDVHDAFAASPLRPPLRAPRTTAAGRTERAPLVWHERPGGLVEVGVDPSRERFCFDNEGPRHKVFVAPFALASRPISVAEVVAFIEAGGYRRPELWLSEGWELAAASALESPAYSRLEGGKLVVFGADGEREADPGEPASHLSFYEADALARFFGARLPTEAEWEHAAGSSSPDEGNFRETGALRPLASGAGGELSQLFGDVWEWTSSAYAPYPGFRAASGALGEYNGKFMINQVVLRGGSCFTPRGHLRSSYRNFWHPGTYFQMTGARLARSLEG